MAVDDVKARLFQLCRDFRRKRQPCPVTDQLCHIDARITYHGKIVDRVIRIRIIGRESQYAQWSRYNKKPANTVNGKRNDPNSNAITSFETLRNMVGYDSQGNITGNPRNRAEIEAYAEAHGIEFYLIDTRAAQLGFGNGTLTVYPPVSYLSDNEACLTVLASFGDYDILATGDISISAERLLLQWYELPDIELLVAGHHGSRNATSMELLQATRPELVVISVGENSYGHPSPETLARIEASGAAVLRTDRSGTITIRR